LEVIQIIAFHNLLTLTHINNRLTLHQISAFYVKQKSVFMGFFMGFRLTNGIL